jgi:hypothetical protein
MRLRPTRPVLARGEVRQRQVPGEGEPGAQRADSRHGSGGANPEGRDAAGDIACEAAMGCACGQGRQDYDEGWQMSERTYTEIETRLIAKECAKEALREYQNENRMLSTAEAADALKVSPRTLYRLNPKRVGGKIPYSWVAKQLGGE